jgi:monoamine oxidase
MPLIIVGGGIAGLSAARELVRQRIPVILLESKNRFGGRMHTIHHRGCPIELGAEFVHGRSPPLIQAIHDAKLTLQSMSNRNQLFQHGKSKPIRLWDLVGNVINQVKSKQPDCSIKQFVEQHSFKAETKRLVLDFVEGFDAAEVNRISSHALLLGERSSEKMAGDKQGRIKEGYSTLVDFLKNEITNRGGVLIKNASVRRIRWKPGQVEIDTRYRSQTRTYLGGAAIFTLPLGIWKAGSVKFDPVLKEKAEVAREFEFGNVLKIIFVFQKQNWIKPGVGIIHAVDEPIPTWWSDPRGPVLTGWAGGLKADALLALPSAKLKTLALKVLAASFPKKVRRLRSKLWMSTFVIGNVILIFAEPTAIFPLMAWNCLVCWANPSGTHYFLLAKQPRPMVRWARFSALWQVECAWRAKF